MWGNIAVPDEERQFPVAWRRAPASTRGRPASFGKVAVGFALVLLLLGLVAVFSYRSATELASASSALRNAYALRSEQGIVFVGLNDAEWNVWAYVGSGDLANAALAHVALETAERSLAEARAIAEADEQLAPQAALLERVDPLVRQKMEHTRETIRIHDESGASAAVSFLYQGVGLQLMLAIRDVLWEMETVTREQTELRAAVAEREATLARAATGAAVILALVLVGLVVLLIRADLDARQRREAALRQSQRELHQFLDGLPLGVLVVGRDGKYVYTNRYIRNLVGEGVPGSEGGGVQDLPVYLRETGEPCPFDRLPVARAMAGVPAGADDLELRVGDRRIPVHVSARPILGENAEVVYAVATLADIRDRLEAQDQLVRAKREAEAASQAKSDFLARMSHELRTPLNSIIGFTSILSKNKNNNLVASDLFYLDRIGSNGRHLLEVINSILDLAKIEAGRLEAQRSMIRLDSLIRETVAGFEAHVAGRQVALEVAVPASPAHLETDRLKLKQILINLVGNAVKFTERGSVTVALHVDEGSGEPLRVEVRDTGPGIPRARLDRIFEAFEQADTSPSRLHEGTGLGLTICRALCENLGYRLEVASRPGHGSVFRVVFSDPPRPAAPADALRNGAAAASGSAANGERAKDRPLVLVVDDQEDARFLVLDALHELGCRTLAAASGEAALELARVARPDVITVDLLMGGLNGAETVTKLRADPTLQDTPIFVVSIVADELGGELDGVAEVIQKPVDRTRLAAALRRHVPARAGDR